MTATTAYLARRWLLGLETVFITLPVAGVAMLLVVMFGIWAGMMLVTLSSGATQAGMATVFVAVCFSAMVSLACLVVVGQLSLRYIFGGRPAIARISISSVA